jgi:hypothetical protein
MNGYRTICSFCGTPPAEDEELVVASDDSAAICEGCVGIAVIAIEEATKDRPPIVYH